MKIIWGAHTIPQSRVTGISTAINRYVYHISKHLIEFGNDVKVYIRDDVKPNESWITPVYSPKFSWIPYPFFLGRKISSETADVFHADYVTTGAALASKKPLIVSIHDAIPFTYNRKELSLADKVRVWWYMRNFKKILNADIIAVGTNHAKNEAVELANISEEKIRIIHFGFEPSILFPKNKEPSDSVKIGYLGGLDGRKNVELLLESYRNLSQKYDNIELHIGGSGRNLEKFKSMNLPRAIFHGPISYENINEFLNSLDIFVFPSLSEGFGLPPIEAMACKVPVVACNSSTMPEIIGDSGILTEPTVESMSEGIERLVQNNRLRNSLAQKGYENSQQFTWERCAQQALDVYEELVRK